MEISPYDARHLAGIRDLIVPIQRQEFEIPITYEEQPDLRDIDGFYRQGNGEFWVAEAKGEVVGSIALLDIGGGQGALRKMFVRADYRGSGHGTAKALLDGLLAHARQVGLSELYLGTTAKSMPPTDSMRSRGFRKSRLRICRIVSRGWLLIRVSIA